VRVISYGGGVQSTALLVLAAQGVIDFPTFLFPNVGDDSEHPDTLTYVRDVAIPWATDRGIVIHELHATRHGKPETLYGRITKPGHRAITIPLRGQNGKPQSRHCTADFKVTVLGQWLKANGASRDSPAIVGIGISVDELERAGNGTDEPHEQRVYPLLDLAYTRSDCQKIIDDAGLPVPPKSACWFCPFHRPATWAEMRRDDPSHFTSAVALEAMVIARQRMLGHAPLYLTRFGKPLDEAIAEAQDTLPWGEGPEGCDEGYCWT
jgi:3'-phosphoadenosine 5'-phosphosulfate sulfotransferase (PAPS reductase)/FAD synthetase